MPVKPRSIANLWRDRRGITALEYGIMASWLAFIIIAAFIKFGADLSTTFTALGSSV